MVIYLFNIKFTQSEWIWIKFKLIKTGHFNSNINHINNCAPINIADKSNDNCSNNNKGNHGVDSIVIDNDDVDDIQLELPLTMEYNARLMICR